MKAELLSEKGGAMPPLAENNEPPQSAPGELLHDFAKRAAPSDLSAEIWERAAETINRELGHPSTPAAGPNAHALKQAIFDDPRPLIGVRAGAYEAAPIDKALLSTCRISIEENTIKDPANGRSWGAVRLLGEAPAGAEPRAIAQPPMLPREDDRVGYGDWTGRLRSHVIPDFAAELEVWYAALKKRPSQSAAARYIQKKAREDYLAEYQCEPPPDTPDTSSIRVMLRKEFPAIAERIKQLAATF